MKTFALVLLPFSLSTASILPRQQSPSYPPSYGGSGDNNEVSPIEGGGGGGSGGSECNLFISRDDASDFISKHLSVWKHEGDYKATARSIAVPNFSFQSYSLLDALGRPIEENSVGEVTNSRDAWAELFDTFVPLPDLETIQILVDCEHIVWFYRHTLIGGQKHPNQGLALFTMERDRDGALMSSTQRVEMDAIAWGEGYGGTYTPPMNQQSGNSSGHQEQPQQYGQRSGQ